MKVGSAKAFIPVTQGDTLGQASLPGSSSVLCQSRQSSGWKRLLFCKDSAAAAKRSARGACPVPQGRAGATGGLPASSSSTDRRMTCDSAWISDNSAASQTEPLSACWKRNALRDQAGEVAYCSSLQELKHTRPTLCCFHIRFTADCNKPL